MHVTACLAGEEVDVEVGESCRTLQALKESIVAALPQLCIEEFDVTVGGRPLDDEGILSLEESVCLDVSANTRGLSVLALREAGREVSEAALVDAVKEGDALLCKLYLDAGVQPDAVAASTNRSPLHHAVIRNEPAICKLLLERGHGVHHVDRTNTTALHLAARWHGRLPICELLLDYGHEVQCTNMYGTTPLHVAAAKNQLEACKLLLAWGHDVQCPDKGQRTPLYFAEKANHRAICALLTSQQCAEQQ